MNKPCIAYFFVSSLLILYIVLFRIMWYNRVLEVFYMRISTSKSINAELVYVIKDYYSKGTRTTKIVEKLGSMKELMESRGESREEVLAWAKEYAREKTKAEEAEHEKISMSFSPSLLIKADEKRLYDCGYLFLQSLLSSLKIRNIMRSIKGRHRYQFDLSKILSDLIYARVLYPSSKLSSYGAAQSFLEAPDYQLHDVYRALEVLADESDFIQAELYKNSNFITRRNGRVLFYDCTNYYFEIEEADDLRKYGKSKEHRPNPIVQMGLFMDGDGIPLAFDIFAGNRNEQQSLKPLELKILQDFELSKVIVCTDAGLASENNRILNSVRGRSFIVTQSLKKLKADEIETALSNNGFRRLSDNRLIDLSAPPSEDTIDTVYYKELPYSSKKLEQRMIITYSPKYAAYQKHIREEQVNRALKMIESGTFKKERRNPNDPARFISSASVTADGEVADKKLFFLNEEKLREEARFDGFYAVCTDLFDDPPADILSVSEKRWEIEECFRIMKHEFKARPVYLRSEDRIRAHFLICFLALLIYRLLEKKLGAGFTAEELIKTLRSMKLLGLPDGFIPAYTRTILTDRLHDTFGFRTDYQILSKKKIREILKSSKTT